MIAKVAAGFRDHPPKHTATSGPIDRPAKPGGFSLPSPLFPAETADR
jgi:hypothetical protein